MEKIKYNEMQITELNNNKYVKNCTWKHIVFTKECKIKALQLSKGYILPRKVFKTLWFPKYVLHSDTPNNSLFRWKKNMTTNWVIEEKKWRKHKQIFDVANMSKDEELEYLRHKVALFEELKNLTSSEYP